MSEIELCKKLEEYFCDYLIYKEVPAYHGGRLDMYVRKGHLWIAVEVKMQLSTKLIYQALRNEHHCHYSYIAIPHLKDTYAGYHICKKLGIGVLAYENLYADRTGPMSWVERVAPRFRRKITPYRVLDIMKEAVAGAQHNSMSEFKITLDEIKNRLRRHNGRYPIKELFSLNHYHYSSSRSARQCITKLCRNGAIRDFKIEGKYFVLTEKQYGDQELQMDFDSGEPGVQQAEG